MNWMLAWDAFRGKWDCKWLGVKPGVKKPNKVNPEVMEGIQRSQANFKRLVRAAHEPSVRPGVLADERNGHRASLLSFALVRVSCKILHPM